MNTANQTTLTMIVLAAISIVAAMYYYPWPEFAQTDEEVGQPLFESYQAKDVRGIDIIKFNSDKSTIDRIKLGRRGEQWVVPARQNFVASQADQIGKVINCLNEKTVYDVISEDQEDHIEFGVVDPTQFSVEENVAALGKKLTLTDRNNQTIADIIVGSAVKSNPSQRYVRIPGKPRVYIIDFDSNLLTTEFFYWVSPNVLNLKAASAEPGKQIRKITIENYQMIADSEEADPQKTSVYSASLAPANGRLAVRSLRMPQGEGWKDLSLTPDQQVKLANAAQFLIRMFVDDVRRKSDELSEAIQFPEDDVDDTVFAKMPEYGFYPAGKKDGEWTFDSANGQVSITTDDGVRSDILIGGVGSENSMGGGKLNYFVMVNSTVDMDFLKEPVRPPGLENDESEENKAFLRQVEQWNSAVEKARQSAREMNSIHADWYYLITQDIVLNLRPEIPLPTLTQPPANDSQDSAETPVNDDAESTENSETDNK